MLTELNRYVYAPIAALALWAVVLALSPEMANAQATHQTQGQQETNREAVVVAPGDTLWSISAKWLGPDATAQQIAVGVQRIYALNQDQIGSDPNLIFAGQKLSLPSAVERRSPELGSAGRTREAAGSTLAKPPRQPQQSAEAQPEAPALPEPARATPIPAVRTLTPNDSSPSWAESVAIEARSSFSSVVAVAGEALPRGEYYSGRKLLGYALIAMSSVLAIILALHVVRTLLGPRYRERRARERWVSGYASANYASSPDLLYWESGQWQRGKFISRLPLRPYVATRDEVPDPHTPVAYSANGEPPSDGIHKIARARRQLRIQRRKKAKRAPRAHAKVIARGVRRGQAVRRAPTSRANRARTLRRTGGR